MENRIDLECRGRKPEEVSELNLDNCKATTVEGLTDEFVNLEVLSLNNVGLTSLRHFPKLPKLRKLELSDNRISAGLEHLAGCPELTHLTLSNNRIKDLEALKVLADFSNLRSLDVYQCEVTAIDEYREKVFQLIPQLEWLDSTDRNNEPEGDSDESEGEGEGDEGEEESSGESVEVDEGSDMGESNEEERDEDDEKEDDEVSEDEEEEEAGSPGLAYLQKSNLEADEEGDEFNPGGDEAESEEIDEDADEEVAGLLSAGQQSQRGVKRKRDIDDIGERER